MKTTDEIYAEMKSGFEDETGISLVDGGDMALRLYAAAAQLSSLWAEADFVSRQSFPQTAAGEYLDHHAALRGLTRAGASKATGTVRFSIAAGLTDALEIPSGVSLMTAAETMFVTTQAGEIAAGALYCDVPAEAVKPGTGGNVPARSVTVMPLPPTGVSGCTNLSAFCGGSNAESDESLRVRVLQSFKKLPNGANAAYYEQQAMSTPGVAAAAVLPKNRGTGTVDVVIASAAGAPSEALIAAVQQKLDAAREICVDIDVAAPTGVSVPVTAQISVKAGYAAAEVADAVESAVTAWFCGERLGRDVLRAELGQVIWNVPGVANYVLAAPSADVTVAAAELPVLGALTVTELG